MCHFLLASHLSSIKQRNISSAVSQNNALTYLEHQTGLLVSIKKLSAKIGAIFSYRCNPYLPLENSSSALSSSFVEKDPFCPDVLSVLFMNWEICNSVSCPDFTRSMGGIGKTSNVTIKKRLLLLTCNNRYCSYCGQGQPWKSSLINSAIFERCVLGPRLLVAKLLIACCYNGVATKATQDAISLFPFCVLRSLL